MKDNFNLKQGPEAIPLPRVLRDAFSSIYQGEESISYTATVEGKKIANQEEYCFLDSKNHAFYLGKLIQENIMQKVAKLLGWQNNDFEQDGELRAEKIYTVEYIKTVLDFLFRHLKKGEKAQFVIGNVLSEIFNGPENVKKTYDAKSLQKKIYKIALRKFKKTKADLDVIDLEEDVLHRDLFQVLRQSRESKTGDFNIEKALEKENPVFLTENPSSLDVAHYLFQKIEKDEELKAEFEKTLTYKQRRVLEQNPNMLYYSLTEISIRLVEILNGRYIHGGPNRQGKYDDVILKIIKGRHSSYQGLKELSVLFKNKRFDMVHIDTENNYFVFEKKRILAWVRLGIFALMTGVAAGSFYEIGKAQQTETFLLTQEKFKASMPELFLPFENKPWHLSKEESTKLFYSKVLPNFKHDLAIRYRIQKDVAEEVVPLFQEFFLKNSQNTYVLEDNVRIDLVDKFVKEHNLLFTSKNIEIKKPYTYLLEMYGDDFKLLLDSDGKDEKITKFSGQEMSSFSPLLSYLGEIISADEDSTNFLLFWYYDQKGKKKIVARILSENASDRTDDVVYSTENARNAVKKLYDAVRRYDALILGNTELFDDILAKNSSNPNYDKDLSINPDDSHLKQIGEYRDTFGEFEYELCVYTEFHYFSEKNTNAYKNYLVARHPGESKFTTKVAFEAAKHWHAGFRSHLRDEYRYIP